MTAIDWDVLARKGSYRVLTPILVRIRDLDMQAHVNNSVIAAYLEEGRYRLLNFGLRKAVPAGAVGGFVVAEQTIRYLREITETGELTVGTRVDRIGNSSFVMGQGIFQGDQCMVTAWLTMVHINRESRRSEHLSALFRSELEAYLPRP